MDSHSLAAYSSHVLDSSVASAELEQRLGLYRVFLKLYEHHRSLLDEILGLENLGSQPQARITFQYVQAVMQGQEPYLITNLLKGKTQALQQPQGIWAIGRDRRLALSISDERMSRLHAVIRYIPHQGFYLIDLESTNGSFVNGEQVRQRILLKDGDQIRLGSLAFAFFVCQSTQKLDTVLSQVLTRLNSLELKSPPEDTTLSEEPEALETPEAIVGWDTKLSSGIKDTSLFLKPSLPLEEFTASPQQLNSNQQADILDRFIKRSPPDSQS